MKLVPFLKNFAQDHVEIVDRPEFGIKGPVVAYGWLHGGMTKPGMSDLVRPGSEDPLIRIPIREQLHPDDKMPNVLLRQEEWGGMAFDTRTQAAYQLDQHAFKVASLLKNGESLDAIRASAKADDLNALDEFDKSARQLGLY